MRVVERGHRRDHGGYTAKANADHLLQGLDIVEACWRQGPAAERSEDARIIAQALSVTQRVLPRTPTPDLESVHWLQKYTVIPAA